MTSADTSSGLTILMVENEEVTACLLEFVLQKNGYRVIHSNNGAHAKSLISTMEPPNAVLFDARLPTQPVSISSPAGAETLGDNTGRHAHDQRREPRPGTGGTPRRQRLYSQTVSPTRLATRLNRLLTDSQRKQTRVA